MKETFGILAVIAVISFALISIWYGIEENDVRNSRTGFSAGYCAALGGEVLNPNTCNVNGKVVVIP